MDTYVTLTALTIAALIGVVSLLRAYFEHEKKIFILTIFLLTTKANGGIIKPSKERRK